MLRAGTDNAADRERLAALLRDARAKANVTQVELAHRLGAPQSVISKYETGERRLDFTEVREICQALGVSFRDLAERFDRE